MKIIIVCMLLAFSVATSAQSSAVPKEIKFERNVVQKMSDKKSSTLSYFYTASGDFAAVQPEEKNKGTLIIYSKDGKMMIVSEKEKTIMIMDMKPFVSRAAQKSEDISTNKKDTAHARGSFKKTGKTKMICSYPAEEYEVSDGKGKSYIWYVKTDFVSFPMLGLIRSNPMTGKGADTSKEWSELPGPGNNWLMAEMEKDEKKLIETISISKTDFTFSSAGYTIRDMSDMMKGNYGQ